MITVPLRRVGTTVLVGAAVVALTVMGRSAADAQPSGSIEVSGPETGVSRVHRTWACDVPSGFTWSSVRINTRCAWRYEYYLLDPVNYNLTGTYACNIPSGYTYTSSRQGSNCSTSGSSYEYRLAKV